MPSSFIKEMLDRVALGVWIYDFDKHRVHWANQKAIEYWDAKSLEELTARDMAIDMSPKIKLRLSQYKQDFERSKTEFHESWTLYPNGTPKRLRVKFSGIVLEDGRTAMMCEATEPKYSEPEAIRGVDALLHTSVMISIFSQSGPLIYCNPAARASFGTNLNLNEKQTQLSDHFVDQDDSVYFLSEMNKTSTCFLTARVYKQGYIAWHNITGAKCLDPVTGDTAFLITEEDVSEAQNAKSELEESRNEALRANQLKSDFVANISHELRTPLNGIIGVAEILKSKCLDDEKQTLINVILESGGTLLNTLNDILDLSKIEANKLEFETVDFAPSSIIKKIENIHKYTAKEKNLFLEIHSDNHAEFMRIGDPHRLTQILHNLTSNAIKFTDKGTVSISLLCASDMPIEIIVKDTGIGMKNADINRLFNSFEQADNSTTRKFGGTGLGMAIVRSLVEGMNGTISIDSTPNIGTTVHVKLPLPMSKKRNISVQHEKQTALDVVHDLSILVIDDIETNHLLLDHMLTDAGAKVIAAHSGAEAIEIIGKYKIDLILCDISMPEMDGVETLNKLRHKEDTFGLDKIPVIAVTANALTHQINEYLQAGFTDYLSKPICYDDLFKTLSKIQFRSKEPQL